MKLPVELLAIAEAEFPKTLAEVAGIRAHSAANSALVLDGLPRFELRRSMIAASAREDVDLAFERYVGSNDLLPLNYLLIGYAQSRAVGRIRYFDKRLRRTAFATGFMVSPDLMMTNHHVFPVSNAAEFSAFAEDAVIEFGYEFDLLGQRGDPIVHTLLPETFLHTSKALDLALVAVQQVDVTAKRQLRDQGYLVLNGKPGTTGKADFATIVQHPDGQEKQISLRNNEIIDDSLADALIYKSDTAQGSSGAPVFNNEWQVIALHSSGVAKKDEAGHYLDKTGQIIPIEDGLVDESRVVWLSNRGIRISSVMSYLLSPASTVSLNPLIQVFASPAYTDSRPFTTVPRPKIWENELGLSPAPSNVTVQPAMTPPQAFGPIEIRVSIGGAQPSVQTTVGGSLSIAVPDLLETEKKLEDERDFSTCLGYLEEFMGVRIPLPIPTPKLRKQLAPLKNSPGMFTLKYHHFTAMQHAVRRVPVLSAINIHGKYRYAALGDDTRRDNWLRDNRIDYGAQLDDKWYAKSGFDKGHLSRREDAEWGSSMASAKAAADMTCSYVNAVPQVPAYNRAIMGYHGQWGRLEQMLLEEGVEGEAGLSARICCFSGPIFLDDDPVYASVQVALSCFKVVVWYDRKGTLRTTGFRLSQEKLVGEIEFEVLNFDKLFKLQQKPLSWIETATGLVFDAILKNSDTFKEESVDGAALERLISGKDASSAAQP